MFQNNHLEEYFWLWQELRVSQCQFVWSLKYFCLYIKKHYYAQTAEHLTLFNFLKQNLHCLLNSSET